MAKVASEGSAEITLRGLVMARWVLLGLLAVAWLLQAVFPGFINPLLAWFSARPNPGLFATIMVFWAAANLIDLHLVVRRGRSSIAFAGAHLLIDTFVLTMLLAISGGATNPFTTLYFVPITLATQVTPRWTWVIASFALACFAALFFTVAIPVGPPGHEAHFAGHLRGMWVAFGISGAIMTVFVHRIALSLAQQREELVRLRQEAIEDRHLAGLGALAAGAAHELGTPLGTIAVLTGELEYMNPDERTAALTDMRRAIARCKTIVQAMVTPELRATALGSATQAWNIADLESELRAEAGEVAFSWSVRGDATAIRQPREVLAQVLRELVKNAADACREKENSRGIELRVEATPARLVIVVHDDGIGMSPQTAAAAFDPFYSTKDGGTGLGLYLVRAHVRQLGGRTRLSTAAEGGAVIELELPTNATSRRTGREAVASHADRVDAGTES